MKGKAFQSKFLYNPSLLEEGGFLSNAETERTLFWEKTYFLEIPFLDGFLGRCLPYTRLTFLFDSIGCSVFNISALAGMLL